MTFIQKTDAETGIYSAEGWDRLLSGWEVVRDNTTAHAGSWSWLVAGDGAQKGSGWALPTYTSGRWFLLRFWVRIASFPSSARPLGLVPSNGSNGMAGLSLNADGTLQADSSGTWGFSTAGKSAALVAGNWHRVEFAGRTDASGSNNWLNAIWRLDGVEFQRHCGRPARSSINKIYAGTNQSAPRVNIDDLVLNDDTGSTANWWNDGTKPLSTGKIKPSVRSVGAAITNTIAGNSIVVNAPSSIASGDTLAMVVEFSNGFPGTITLPSGWTQRTAFFPASGGGGLLIATKVATGSEPSTYTVSWANSGFRGHSVCYALAGVNASQILDAQSLGVTVSNTEANFMIPALDLPEGDALVLQAASMTEATTKSFVNPAWWSSATNVSDTTNGQALACGVFGQDDGGLTATGLMSATANITGSVSVAAIAFRSSDTSHILVDPSSPPVVKTTSGQTIASPSFSPPANSLLLIGVGNANNTNNVISMTDNLGTPLTYTKKIASTGSGGQGDGEFWVADVPSTAPGPMAISATFNGSGNSCNVIGVLVLTSADPVALQAGATARGNWNQAGSTAIAITTLKDNSRVFAFTADWNSATAPTFPSGQTDIFNGNLMLGQNVPSGIQCFLHGYVSQISPARSVSQSFAVTGPGFGSQVAIEIQPASVALQTNKFMAVA